MTVSLRGTSRRAPSAVLPVASIVVVLATTGAVRAQDLCADIDYLIGQSRSQFAEILGKPNDDAGGYDVTLTLAGASYCSVTKRSKKRMYRCGWEFPYRAKRAYETFDELVRAVNDCIGRSATLHRDQSVNHPDYYALRRYETEQADVSVSVKDKSALGSTLVSIRVQRGKSK